MCFSINLDVQGKLSEDELLVIWDNFDGKLTSSESASLVKDS